LYEKNADALRYPASLTKMMTLYLTFEALKNGDLDIGQSIPVSAKAAGQPQTNISLDQGDRLPVRTAIESVVVRSANDSAMALGEALGRTEFNFALMMTQKARELGMKNTVFRNPNGLPDNKQHTTALDMAKLAIALRRDFPEYYHYFKLTSFEYNGVTYPGHNHVMERYPGVDGVKTGFIRASGFNLVTSIRKDGHSIVAVILGGSSIASRDNQMIALLDKTFEQLEAKNKGAALGRLISDDRSSQAGETLQARAN
jgi:D-alanyl-D-alanine carboxypeptidase